MYRDTLDGCVIQRNLINKVAESPHDIDTLDLYDELLRAIIDASDIASMCAYGSNEVTSRPASRSTNIHTYIIHTYMHAFIHI